MNSNNPYVPTNMPAIGDLFKGLASRMNISNMQNEGHVGIQIDGIYQKVCVVEKILAVGPVAEYGDRHLVGGGIVLIVGEHGLTKRSRGEEQSCNRKFFHEAVPC